MSRSRVRVPLLALFYCHPHAPLSKQEGICGSLIRHRGVAQFGSAFGSGPKGRGFESRHFDTCETLANAGVFLLLGYAVLTFEGSFFVEKRGFVTGVSQNGAKTCHLSRFWRLRYPRSAYEYTCFLQRRQQSNQIGMTLSGAVERQVAAHDDSISCRASISSTKTAVSCGV